MGGKFSIRSVINNWLNPLSTSIPVGFSSDGSVVYLNTTNPNVALSFTAVYACVNVISETIATLPFNLFKHIGNRTQKAVNHSVYNIIHYQASEHVNKITFWETTLMHLLLHGNSYSEIERDYLGNIKALNILEPSKITVCKDENGKIFYRYLSRNGVFDLPASKVFHIKGKSLDGIVGLSPISLFARTITTGIKQEELTNKFVSNGASKIPIFTHPNAIKPDGKVKLKEALQEAWGKSKVIVLEEGLQFNSATMNMTDAQIIESKIFSVSEIARIYRMPLHKIAELTHATFSNIEHQSIEFVKDTIVPWCSRIEYAIEHQLLSKYERGEYFAKINTEALLRGDTINRNRALEMQFKNGIINREDWARLEDLPLPEDDNSKDYFISQQVRPIKTAYQVNNKNNQSNKNSKENNSEDKEDGTKQ